MKKLAFIESKTEKFGKFNLSDGISDLDLPQIERLYAMCRGESWKSTASWQFKLSPDAGMPPQTQGDVSMTLNRFDTWELLGVRIPLGKVKVTLTDSEEFLRAMNEAIQSETFVVDVRDVEARYELVTWGEPEEDEQD